MTEKPVIAQEWYSEIYLALQFGWYRGENSSSLMWMKGFLFSITLALSQKERG